MISCIDGGAKLPQPQAIPYASCIALRGHWPKARACTGTASRTPSALGVCCLPAPSAVAAPLAPV
eukprot:2954735-Pyramimonas_sp.AAC.1